MSQTTSATTGRRYGLERVCRLWEESRSAFYARRARSDRRRHGTTGEVPLERFAREAESLRPCAGRPPFGQLRDLIRTVHADCAVVVDTNAYSVPWRLIGERVRVVVSGGRVRVHHGRDVVAEHPEHPGRHERVTGAFGPEILYAVDAATGELVESFGRNGLLQVAREALTFKYPDTYPPTVDTTAMGFAMTNPPTYADGTLFVGLPFSEGLLPGGLLAALDGSTGAMRWVFNTIPQGPQDSGWEIANGTWSSAKRYGGGVWMQPAIDTELGMVYINAANPSPNYDGSSRLGINLFTNSMLAIDIETGELAWHFQTLHHDIWDWDLASGPILFDVTVDGRPVKAVASLGKTCYVYILDRATGEPINPIVETAVPRNTDVPGEEVWPTQPVPYNARGVPQEPFCATYPIVTDPELAPRTRQLFHPYQVNEFVITSPGNTGGANYGSPSFSPRTGLLYVTGKNDAWSIKVKVVGDTLEPGPGYVGHFGNIAELGGIGMTPSSTLAAYDPGTGEQVWYVESEGATNGGNLVTAGNVVFQGVGNGNFYGFDAQTGRRLFTYDTERSIHASPLAYQVNSTQYVAIAAVNAVFAFGLP